MYLGAIEEIVSVCIGVDNALKKCAFGKSVHFNVRFPQLDDGAIHTLADKAADKLYSINDVSAKPVCTVKPCLRLIFS